MQIVPYDYIWRLPDEKEEKKASDILITVSLSDSPNNPASHCYLNFNPEGNPHQPPNSNDGQGGWGRGMERGVTAKFK